MNALQENVPIITIDSYTKATVLRTLHYLPYECGWVDDIVFLTNIPRIEVAWALSLLEHDDGVVTQLNGGKYGLLPGWEALWLNHQKNSFVISTEKG